MSVNFNNIQNPYLNTAQNENFGAMTPEAQAKLQKVEATAKETAKETTKDTMFQTMFVEQFGFDFSKPKRLLFSLASAAVLALGLRFGFSKLVKNNKLVNGTNKLGNYLKEVPFIKTIGSKLKTASSDPAKLLGKAKKLFTTLSTDFKNSSLYNTVKFGKNAAKNPMGKSQVRGTWGELVDTVTDSLRKLFKNEEAFNKMKKFTTDSGSVPIEELEDLVKKPRFSKIKNLFGKGKNICNLTDEQMDTVRNALGKIKAGYKLDDASSSLIENILKNTEKGARDDGFKALAKFFGSPSSVSVKELMETLQDTTKTTFLKAEDKTKILDILTNLSKETRKNSQKELIDIVNVLRKAQKTGVRTELTEVLQAMVGGNKNTDVSDLVKCVEKFSKDDTAKFDEFEKIYKRFKEGNGLLITRDGKEITDPKKLIEVLSNGPLANINIKTEGGLMSGQNVNLSEAMKKIAMIKGDTAENTLAKIIQILGLRGSEAISNGVASKTFFGSALAVMLYNGTFAKVHDAPKKEKVSTFTEEAVTDMGNYMMMPAAAGIIYKLGNLKNWGLMEWVKNATTGENEYVVKAGYKSALDKAKKVIENAEGGIFKRMAAKREARNIIDDALKSAAGGSSLPSRIVKWFGRKLGKIFSFGLDDNILKGAAGNKIRGGVGGAGRLIGILVLSSMLLKPILKISRTLFGKTSTVKKEEEEAKKRKEEKNNPVNTAEQPSSQLPAGGPTNYLEMIDAYNKAQQQANQPQAAQPQPQQQTPAAAAPTIPTNGEIPARKINNDENKNNQIDDPNRSYIPNPVQTLTKATTKNYSQPALDAALQQAANAEKLAEKFV